MYSPHQMVPSLPGEPFASTYDGKEFEKSGKETWDLTDQQKEFLEMDMVRHVLVLKLEDVDGIMKCRNSRKCSPMAAP